MPTTQGPAELVLMATVARHHYLQGRSKVQIAEQLGVSRFKVARLLDAAREAGLVRIEIDQPDGINLDLSAQLQEQHGLTHCAVLSARQTRPSTELQGALGSTAARLLTEVLVDSDVLGLPWSRSVLAMTEQLAELPQVEVVQLPGALELSGYDATAVDLVRRAARVAGGATSIFHAPFVLDDVPSAQALRRQSRVRAGLAAADRVTHAVVGVGAWGAGLSTIYEVATEQERRSAADAGVVGEVAGVLFDSWGRPVPEGLTERLVTLSADRLVGIPDVIAIASGRGKAAALRAALQGGLVNALVTDSSLATELLRAPPN